jgi:hypothetical protein
MSLRRHCGDRVSLTPWSTLTSVPGRSHDPLHHPRVFISTPVAPDSRSDIQTLCRSLSSDFSVSPYVPYCGDSTLAPPMPTAACGRPEVFRRRAGLYLQERLTVRHHDEPLIGSGSHVSDAGRGRQPGRVRSARSSVPSTRVQPRSRADVRRYESKISFRDSFAPTAGSPASRRQHFSVGCIGSP